jgi:protein-tyrosine phosphatase
MRNAPSDNLRIDPVDVPRVTGRLGLCACPGWRHGARALQLTPAECLQCDIESMRSFGASGLVSLIEPREMAALGIDELPQYLDRAGLWWKHLPITDMGIPDQTFESRWVDDGAAIRDALGRGEHVVLHCWAGLGRTGTLAARLLIEFGMQPEAAILRVRHARPGAIQTRSQERYVLNAASRG